MDEKKKRILTIVFILVNLIIWGLFIIPRVGRFSEAISSNLTPQASTPIIEHNENTIELLQRVDFHTLRDPFRPPSGYRSSGSTRPVTRSTTTTTTVPPWAQQQQNNQVVERSFTSRFKLASIMQFENSYIATLEEASHYGSGSPAGVPYSYRFGEQQSSSSTTHMVIEGDSVMDERVAKIAKDYVVMEKDNLYYKLTFSGGFPVSQP